VPQPDPAFLTQFAHIIAQNPSLFDADGEKTWVWHCNGEMAPYDVDDDVFFLVMQCLQIVVQPLRVQLTLACLLGAGLQRGLRAREQRESNNEYPCIYGIRWSGAAQVCISCCFAPFSRFLFNLVLGGVIHLWVLFRIVRTKLVE
jgi:hypothetical protein